MTSSSLYPLLFDPVFQYRLWGGRDLEDFMSASLPGPGPYGEAWILSDRDDISSVVTNGPLKGRSLTELMRESGADIMGPHWKEHSRFPLLLKFLDCQEMLSVQVHPSDDQTELLPQGENGKTEAWVVLKAGHRSKIYEGLEPGTTRETLRTAISDKTLGSLLPSFAPKPGDAVYIPAGTVHALGNGVMVFEVQENSDVTFRLYDWDRVDEKTGKPRELHVEKGLASIDFDQRAGHPVVPVTEPGSPIGREQLFLCGHFEVWRTTGPHSRSVGAEGEPRILVCLEGSGIVRSGEGSSPLKRGAVMLLPAAVGQCVCEPDSPMTLLEIAIPGPV